MQMVWYLLCTLSTPLPNKFRILRSSVFGYFLEEVNKLIPFQDSPQSNPTCLTKPLYPFAKSTLGAYLLPLSRPKAPRQVRAVFAWATSATG